MPVLEHEPFRPPFYLFNKHLETIVPALRKVAEMPFVRERITTPDGDFLDVDILHGERKKLVILSHGLEGHSRRPYIMGMANKCAENGYGVVAWNFRGCSGEDNVLPVTYHTGRTADLHCVIEFALQKLDAHEIHLIGFSLGGNMILKYAGDGLIAIPGEIKTIIAISPPCDLGGSADVLHHGFNKFYERRFMKGFTPRIIRKSKQFPGKVSIEKLKIVKSIRDFDNYFTGPINGFKDDVEFYAVNSSMNYVHNIQIKTLILSAQNDPFLSPGCYPITSSEKNKNVLLEITKHGGHTGFKTNKQSYYHELRSLDFMDNAVNILTRPF